MAGGEKNSTSGRIINGEKVVAKADWKQARFDFVPNDHEFIQLSEPEPEIVRPTVVNYP
jgi:hypothetical protein